jgi:hypothetical protein
MIRRRLIRGLAILLVVACAAAWVRSYHSAAFIILKTRDSVLRFESLRGKICLAHHKNYLHEPGWQFGDDDSDFRRYFPQFETEDRSHVLRASGFSYGRFFFRGGEPNMYAGFGVPYWFINSFGILIGLLVWRKTRTPNPATAFPVETKKQVSR